MKPYKDKRAKSTTVPHVPRNILNTYEKCVVHAVPQRTTSPTKFTRKDGKRMDITLRPYQQECIDAIPDHGSHLIQMATGLGKTVTFSRIPRNGRMLILSHREELVKQPLKYFDCATGIEMAGNSAPRNAEVVSASVQSIVRRLDKYDPCDFDIIVTDEAHHAAARTYRKVYDYFRPRLHLGFTATPNRGDKVRLDGVFDDIIFARDLRFGIQNGYLSDIMCRRVHIGYDLTGVRTRNGDFAPGELEQAMDGTADAIAEAYRELATGATLIFAVSVKHANDIAAKIPEAVVVTGETKNRAEIVQRFTDGEIPCLINCMVFTEGTDIPRVETVIIARPTQSESLYAQMVGRGLRLYPGKERLNLIDCVGVSSKASLCTAPSLLGIDMDTVPARKADDVQGMIFDLPTLAAAAADCPESWIRNVEIVNLWAKGQQYNTHDVAWFKMPDGSLVLSLPDRKMVIPPQDELGRTRTASGMIVTMQDALDMAYRWLCDHAADARQLWDNNAIKRWGREPASEKQISLVRRMCKNHELDLDNLTKGQASMILNRLIGAGKARSA